MRKSLGHMRNCGFDVLLFQSVKPERIKPQTCASFELKIMVSANQLESAPDRVPPHPAQSNMQMSPVRSVFQLSYNPQIVTAIVQLGTVKHRVSQKDMSKAAGSSCQQACLLSAQSAAIRTQTNRALQHCPAPRGKHAATSARFNT